MVISWGENRMYVDLCSVYIFPIFRDNGISIQIIISQLYCEFFMFLLLLIFAIIPIEKPILLTRIAGLINNFVIYIVQPLFYFNGDINFR